MSKINKNPSVFLSHSSKDNEFVRRLEEGLEKNGIEVWVDYDRLDVGNSLYGEIAPAIEEADYFALLWSGTSSTSPWVKREMYAALSREDRERREIILPVLMENIPLPTLIQHQVYADFSSEDKFDDSLKRLVKAIQKAVPKSTTKIKTDGTAAQLYPNQFLPDLKFFVGREELLQRIKDTLSTHHRAAIHDISGLGKTFTTYKFAEDNQENYEKIFFIRATREEMLESLAKCGEMVEPGLAEITEQRVKALGFKQWLEENEKWLVIYDNVDLPDELFKFVPVSKKGDCLFTSNFREVRNLGTEISIVKLERTDAEILLFSRANNKPLTKPDLGGEELAAFNSLLEEIDGLPLTLNSTGALIDKKQWSFVDMWQRYKRSAEIVWESEDDYSAYQRRSAGIVFSLAYDELCCTEETGSLVKTVLDSMSFISPDEIPEDLLQEILKVRDESFSQAAEPDDLWDSVREKLTAYDLLKYDRHKKTFTTHRAIQRVILSRLKGNEKEICTAIAPVFRKLFPQYDYSNRVVCEKYFQHVLVLLENADKLRAETADTNELYFKAGCYQKRLGNYTPAEKFHLRAAEISASVFGVGSQSYATDLNDLAGVYKDQGKYDEAIEKYEVALRIDEETIGRKHSNYATRLNNLALVYKLQGRYDEAIEKYEEALRIDEITIGREHPDYATHLNNLANVYYSQGRHKEAIEKLEEALRIAEKTIGSEHPEYSVRLSNLGEVYRTQGLYNEAIEKFEQALLITERRLGSNHPNLGIQLTNLAAAYADQGRYAEAKGNLERALQIGEKTIGKEHPYYAGRLNNLALIHETHGNYREAFDLYKNALRIFEKTLPEGHPNIAQLRESVERCGKKLVD
jgi:tetratricopeptide (TPR) repeat protein